MADYSADPLRQMVKRGKAMPAPGQDRAGRFPIKNKDDLQNAIKAVGRVTGGPDEQAKVRRFIQKRHPKGLSVKPRGVRCVPRCLARRLLLRSGCWSSGNRAGCRRDGC